MTGSNQGRQSSAGRLGTVSAVVFTLATITLIVANVGILGRGQWPDWRGPESYGEWLAGLAVDYWAIAFAAAFVMIIAFAGLMAALYAITDEGKKAFSILSLVFTGAAMVLESIVYVVQLGPVRRAALGAGLQGLSPWIYHAPNSVIFALDILGYFFLGLATFAAAWTFGRDKVARLLFWLFIAFGVESLFGLAAQLAGSSVALAVYNLVMTLTLAAAGPPLFMHFRRITSRPS